MPILERISQHSFLPDLVRNDSIVLDLGGNRGEFSQIVQERYGWKVAVVEPNPELAEYLRGLGLNVMEAAVTGEDGSTRFTFDPGKEMTGSVLDIEIVGSLLDKATSRQVIEVPTCSLKALLKDRMVDLVKVDIEGGELGMFLSASDETILEVGQYTVEFHDFWYPELAEQSERVKKRLKGLGFSMMRGTPNNKDVLFVNPRFRISRWLRFYIYFWLRNLNGLRRAASVLSRRIVGAKS